jgi:hypothetical protein
LQISAFYIAKFAKPLPEVFQEGRRIILRGHRLQIADSSDLRRLLLTERRERGGKNNRA